MGKLGKAFVFLMTVMLLLTVISRAASSFTVAQVSVETPQARKITHTVTGDGVVEQMREQPVYAPAGILVAEVLVQPGQTVKKGDVLARLDMDSLEEKLQALEDEIEGLKLQNQSILSQQQKSGQEQSKANRRAKEDYDNTLEENQRDDEEAKRKVEEAEEQLSEAEELAAESYEKTCEELQRKAGEAERAYEEAKELAEAEILQAKRAMEDAGKTPAEDYGKEQLQLQIDEKQRELEELYKRRREGEEGLDQQIRSLENEAAALRLQMWGKVNAESRQEQERKQAVLRAQEDYGSVVKKCDRIVSEAFDQWNEAKQALEDYLEGGWDVSEDASVKAAAQALEEAKRQEQQQKYQEEAKELLAKRALEDSAQGGAKDTTAEINRLLIGEKERQLAELEKEKEDGGAIVARAEDTVTQVFVAVGQRTSETAAFLMSDTSGGLLFTTVISREDAEYAVSEGTVMLESAGKAYEELSILSMEANEDETVTVTVLVPADTLSLGAYARMELTKQSEEYGVTVSIAAVHTENNKNFVYVMEEEDTVLGGQYMAQRVEVTVAEKNGMFAALTGSSLTSESLVIVNSDQMIFAGERVRLKEE